MNWTDLDMEKKRYLLLLCILLVVLGGTGVYLWAPWEEREVPVVVETADISIQEPPLVVYVSGAVKQPGVYEMPGGSRVYEAVKAAGDVLPYADVDAVNMAAVVEDGGKIHIPLDPMRVTPVAPGMAVVNINTATQAELETLPGIGAVTARKILDYRNAHGGFQEKEDLMKVPSIGEGRYRKVQDQITL